MSLKLPPLHYDHMLGVAPWVKEIAIEGDNWGYENRSAFLSYIDARMPVPPSTAMSIYSMLGYKHFGQNTYAMGPVLQHMLAKTSLKGVQIEEVKLPFESFYIAFEDCDWNLWGGDVTQWHQLAGAYVSYGGPECRHEDRLKGITVLLWGKENDKSRMAGDDATFWYSINLDDAKLERTLNGLAPILHEDMKEEIVDLETYLKDMLEDPDREVLEWNDGTVGEWDDGTIGNGDHLMKVGTMFASSPNPADRRKELNSIIAAVNRCIINFLLYIQSDTADIGDTVHKNSARKAELMKKLQKYTKRGNQRQQRKVKQRLATLSEARITYIGQKIEKKARAQGITGKAMRQSLGRMWRPGYYNYYWTGSKKDEQGTIRLGSHRIRKWIEPYEINKDMARLVDSRIRKVVEPEVSATL